MRLVSFFLFLRISEPELNVKEIHCTKTNINLNFFFSLTLTLRF